MGTNKALLRFKGMPMVDHMREIMLQAGLEDVYISGNVPGYACIPDKIHYSGPAHAMRDILTDFRDRYEKLVFVPVDMPLLDPRTLRELMERDGDAYYENHPLPACLFTGRMEAVFDSVKDILKDRNATPVTLAPERASCMINANTPEEWGKAAT